LFPILVFPQIQWGEEDKARLQVIIQLYTDFIVLSKVGSNGKVTEEYLVHPAELTAALSGINLSSGLLPQNCLFWSRQEGFLRIGIYIPPQVHLVTMRGEVEAWRIPLPGLIMIGHNLNYSLWAVKEPPVDPRIPIYMAPCPNVHPQGICQGNAPFPPASPATMWQAMDVFFGSKFNRDLSDGKSRQHPNSVVETWQELNKVRAEEYPLDDLVATNLTLGRLIDD
jgi:hypothetical protein